MEQSDIMSDDLKKYISLLLLAHMKGETTFKEEERHLIRYFGNEGLKYESFKSYFEITLTTIDQIKKNGLCLMSESKLKFVQLKLSLSDEIISAIRNKESSSTKSANDNYFDIFISDSGLEGLTFLKLLQKILNSDLTTAHNLYKKLPIDLCLKVTAEEARILIADIEKIGAIANIKDLRETAVKILEHVSLHPEIENLGRLIIENRTDEINLLLESFPISEKDGSILAYFAKILQDNEYCQGADLLLAYLEVTYRNDASLMLSIKSLKVLRKFMYLQKK